MNKQKTMDEFRDRILVFLGQVEQHITNLQGVLRHLENSKLHFIDKLDAMEDIEKNEKKSDAFVKALKLLREE